MRLVIRLGAVVLLGLTLVPALAGAAPGDQGAIVFSSAEGLRRLDPDSGQSAVIRPRRCVQDGAWLQCYTGASPSWSPDGRRIAFVEQSALRVIDEDGRNERTLPTGVIVETVAPRWSPDGSRLAFFGRRYSAGATYLYVIGVEGGPAEELTPNGSFAVGPASWSPDGTQLAVAERPLVGGPYSQIFITAADASARRQLTSAAPPVYALQPVWSPDGLRVAFARVSSTGSSSVATIELEGTGETVIFPQSAPHSARPVQWTEDGRVLIEQLGDQWRPGGTDLYSVRGDGTDLRRLTHSVERYVHDGAPVISPDGNRIAFSRREAVQGGYRQALWTANGDGTCERLGHVSGNTPDWRPGSTANPVACSVTTLLRPRPQDVVDGQFDVQVLNDGTEPLRSMRLVAQVERWQSIFVSQNGEACPLDGTTVRCPLPDLRRGELATLHVEVKARVLRQQRRGYEAVASSLVLEPVGERFDSTAQLHTCSQHDPGSGGIRGTGWSDTICGRTGEDAIFAEWGSDLILGGRGDDRIEAGPGTDELDGGPGNDVLLGGAGRDRIYARDRARDRISCGTGRDVVVADRGDRVARNCERVSRR